MALSWYGRSSRPPRKIQEPRADIVELERRVETLSLLCRAMWTLLQDRFGFSEEEILKRATELDLLDGRADGRVSVPAKMCTSCNRIIAPHHVRCLYCGAEKFVDSVFEKV